MEHKRIPHAVLFFGLIAFTIGVLGAVAQAGIGNQEINGEIYFSPPSGTEFFFGALVPVIFLGISFLLLFTALQKTKKVERYNV